MKMISISHLQTNTPTGLLTMLALLCVFADSVAAQEPELAAPIPVRQLATLCGEENPCDLIAVHDAGRDADGNALRVVELSLDGIGDDEILGSISCAPYPGDDSDERVFALLADEPGGDPTQVLSICNDGYGAAGVGEDHVEIAHNRFVHSQNGGSNWRWFVRNERSLSPPNLLSVYNWYAHTLTGEFNVRVFDQSRLRGAGVTGTGCYSAQLSYDFDERRYYYSCTDEGGWLGVDAGVAQGYLYVPSLADRAVDIDELAPLGSCSSSISEDLRPGFLIHGDRIEEGTGATLRYVMGGGRALIVTVVDDRFEAGGSTWIHDDHLEIWARSPEGNLVQWGLGIDGTAHSAYGDPPPLDLYFHLLDEEGDLMRATFGLEMPWNTESITLVYSQAEDRRQHRLFGTSAFEFGNAATLGQVREVDWQGLLCTERNGRIELIPPAE